MLRSKVDLLHKGVNPTINMCLHNFSISHMLYCFPILQPFKTVSTEKKKKNRYIMENIEFPQMLKWYNIMVAQTRENFRAGISIVRFMHFLGLCSFQRSSSPTRNKLLIKVSNLQADDCLEEPCSVIASRKIWMLQHLLCHFTVELGGNVAQMAFYIDELV